MDQCGKIIVSQSKKGGVGKTLIATSVAFALAKQDAKVLLIDLDAQGQCAVMYGVPGEMGVFNLLVLDMPFANLVRHTGRFDLWLLPGNLTTGRADVTQARFEAALAPALADYDYVVFDTAASGQLREHAIAMADTVLTVAGLGSLEVDGVRLAMDEVRENNPSAQSIIVPNELDKRLAVHQHNLVTLQDAFEGSVISPIPSHVRVRELASAQQTIWEYAPKSPVIPVLEELLDWITRPEEFVLFDSPLSGEQALA